MVEAHLKGNYRSTGYRRPRQLSDRPGSTLKGGETVSNQLDSEKAISVKMGTSWMGLASAATSTRRSFSRTTGRAWRLRGGTVPSAWSGGLAWSMRSKTTSSTAFGEAHLSAAGGGSLVNVVSLRRGMGRSPVRHDHLDLRLHNTAKADVADRADHLQCDCGAYIRAAAAHRSSTSPGSTRPVLRRSRVRREVRVQFYGHREPAPGCNSTR